MNLPKDWSKKPDWLDKASEPGLLRGRDWLMLGITVGGLVLALISLVRFALWLVAR
jgi:hypothetical protein